jgi:hypothetical protein
MNVRVFFRLFVTQSSDTDFDPNGTYKSFTNTQGTIIPLVGAGNTTIPFFATGNVADQYDYAQGAPNTRTLAIPAGQDSLWAYFGCLLNFYDLGNMINGKQIQSYLTGTHHCLVAQIDYADAPIPTGASPVSWDQLAQRNLQITRSDNPGPASTHRIPQTFDCRPSAGVTSGPNNQGIPDELMIDWGQIPSGSVASLYWPQVMATDVMDLANQFYSSNPLTVIDTHTIGLRITGGLSYVPIPGGAGDSFAGLFTVDLPQSVTTGQQFEIVVRRIASRRFVPTPPVQTPAATHILAAKSSAGLAKGAFEPRKKPAVLRTIGAGGDLPEQSDPSGTMTWRYVTGTFQVWIPVMTGDQILPAEQTTLAIMKWRLNQMLPSNRWYPVLQRYIEYISGRVDAGPGDNIDTTGGKLIINGTTIGPMTVSTISGSSAARIP